MPKKPSSLEIHLLGPFQVLVDGQVIDESRFTRRKPKQFVKLLALQPHHRLHREQAMEWLWPDSDPKSAANNLHKAIHMARHALEPSLKSVADSHLILTQGQQVLLSVPGSLWVDVDEFEVQIASANRDSDIEKYEAARALHKGDLLVEDLYEDWTRARRESVAMLYCELLSKLAQLYESGQRYQHSIDRLKELLGRDETNEEIHCRLMRLYALTGNHHQAVRQYQQCAEVMRRELDAEPDSETVDLYRQIESRRASHGQTAIKSVAILPLANQTADLNMEYLSDGITENIINRLSQLPALRVMAWSTVAQYKGRQISPPAVGRELQVGAVMTGRVLEVGERLVVKIELVAVADGSQLWGAQYNRKASDIFAVQEEIAQETSEKLLSKLTGEDIRRLTERQTENTKGLSRLSQGQVLLESTY